MEMRGVRGVHSSPLAIATYLHELRPIVNRVTARHREWIRDIGRLLEDARHSTSHQMAIRSAQIGRAEIQAFREARAEISALMPPPECVAVTRAALDWVEAHVQACELMVEIGASDQIARLPQVQQMLGDGRRHAHRFNSAYLELLTMLRRSIEAAHQRPAKQAS